MTELYLLNIEEELSEEMLQDLLDTLPRERQERVHKYRFSKDARRSIFSGALMNYMIYTNLGYRESMPSILYNEYGKPYITTTNKFYFNLSHSGAFVIGGCSNGEIGVDIEEVKEIDLNIAKRFFSECEYHYLKQMPYAHQKRAFFEIWTLKESYIKYKGKGLNIPLNSFSFDLSNNRIQLDSEDVIKPIFFKVDVGVAYELAVCSEATDAPTIREITPKDLWHTLCTK